MKFNAKTISGWALTILLAVFLIGLSAGGKFTEWEGKADMMNKLGWDIPTIKNIGYVEVAVTILFLIPQTAFLGAILLTGYLGGAIATHVRIHDDFTTPLIMGILVWVTLALRQPGVFRMAFGSFLPPSKETPQSTTLSS